jgi:hypothetical protein
MIKTSWEVAMGESMNYVNDIKADMKFYSYETAQDVKKTHEEMCKLLTARLNKVDENMHLAFDYLRGAGAGETDKKLQDIKDEVGIFRDEVRSSYVDWKSPKSHVIKAIIKLDIGIVRNSEGLLKISDEIREVGISRVVSVLNDKVKMCNDIMRELTYLFYERERLCRE